MCSSGLYIIEEWDWEFHTEYERLSPVGEPPSEHENRTSGWEGGYRKNVSQDVTHPVKGLYYRLPLKINVDVYFDYKVYHQRQDHSRILKNNGVVGKNLYKLKIIVFVQSQW